MNFPSMHGDVSTVTSEERSQIWQDINRNPETRGDFDLHDAWVISLADLRLALDWQGNRPGPKNAL